MEGWRQGDHSAREKVAADEEGKQIHLTPAGLLIEGVITTLRLLFAEYGGANVADSLSRRCPCLQNDVHFCAFVFTRAIERNGVSQERLAAQMS